MSRTMARPGRRGKRIPIACEPPTPAVVVGDSALHVTGAGAALIALMPETIDVAFVASLLGGAR